MSAAASTHWFWSDWLGDQAVRRLTPAERGVWIDLLALASASSPIGYVCDEKGRALTLEEIARVTNAGSPDEVSKLIAGILDKGACSRDRTGRLFNRRMVRDAERQQQKKVLGEKRAKIGRGGGERTKAIWRDLNNNRSLPQQLPQQQPRQLPQLRRSDPSNPISKTLSTEQASASSELVNSIREKGWR